MWDAWKAGDRDAATESIPDEVLDELIVHGSPAESAEHVLRYVANGVTTPAPDDPRRPRRRRSQASIAEIAPSA